MGMAASQARLLCLTARIHDVEYQAQSIQSAKVQLATQSDQVYNDYLAALDASTLTINAIDTTTGNKSIIPASFNNLCSRNRVTPADGNTYAIRNADKLLLVEDEIEEVYNTMDFESPYQFALYMMNRNGELQGVCNMDSEFLTALERAEESAYTDLSEQELGNLKALREKVESYLGEDSDGIYDSNSVADENKADYEKALEQYRNALYQKCPGLINAKLFTNAGEDTPVEEDEFDRNSFNYFVSIYKQIQASDGCISINEYGDAANNTEWLQNMVQCAQFTIEIVNTNKEGKVSLDTTSPGADSCISYTPTSTIDNRALAKAEAEYENKMKQIDKKDQKFDLELSKLETERSALTTEYESVKKVISDNVERTFGIFS